MNDLKVIVSAVFVLVFLSLSSVLIKMPAKALGATGGGQSATTVTSSTANSMCAGINGKGTIGSDGNCTSNSTDISNIITDIINIFSWAVGVISVIMIILGGFRYVTSAGAEKGVSSAKNTILYAIVGLVIVGLAQIIVHFVVGQLFTAGG